MNGKLSPSEWVASAIWHGRNPRVAIKPRGHRTIVLEENSARELELWKREKKELLIYETSQGKDIADLLFKMNRFLFI